MIVAFALLAAAALAYLVGHNHGRSCGRFEMARLVELKYGPLLQQLEQFVDSIEDFAPDLSANERHKVEVALTAMREASRWN